MKFNKFLNEVPLRAPLRTHFFQKTTEMSEMQGVFFWNSLSYFTKNTTQSDRLLLLFPRGFHIFANTASNFLALSR